MGSARGYLRRKCFKCYILELRWRAESFEPIDEVVGEYKGLEMSLVAWEMFRRFFC